MGKDRTELSDEDYTRIDDVQYEVFRMIKKVAPRPEMEWNQKIIGELSEIIAEYLSDNGISVWYPYVEDDGTNCQVKSFYEAKC